MSNKPSCENCGKGSIDSSWKHCPDCGHSVKGEAFTSLEPIVTKPSEQNQRDRKVVYQQANRDLKYEAYWILFLAILGTFGVGWILINRGNFEVGAIAILISLVCLLFLRASGSRAQKQVASGCLASFSVLFLATIFFILWWIATIIFMIETCFRSLQ